MIELVDIADRRASPVDVCVVGSGPVGLGLAAGLARRGLRVLMLESGGPAPNAARQALSEAARLTERQASLSLATCRALGGTSWFWGGRCLPLDPIDFSADSGRGWPICAADLKPYHDEAAELLGCGEAVFQDAPAGVAFDAAMDLGLRADQLERWSDEPVLPKARVWLGAATQVSVATDAMVIGADLDSAGGRLAGLEVAGPSGRVRIEAPAYVFACGGLETTRLLLAVQASHPELFGGKNGPLGRGYMGHLSGRIADIYFNRPDHAEVFSYWNAASSGVRRRLTFDERLLRDEDLPNVAFYPDNPKLSDPTHGSAALSLVYLVLSTPGLGRHLISEAILRMQVDGSPRRGAHLANLLGDLPRALTTCADLLGQKLIRRRRKPHLFLQSRSGCYPLHYHAEHMPRPESRVVLARTSDAFGLPRLDIDLRFAAEDAQRVVRAHEALDQRLRQSGLGRLIYHHPREQRAAAALDQARDGFHQIGLTRMAAAATNGVADGNCRAFGLDNLYLAGSSLFCSSGQANPTFSAVALALRLSDYLARSLPRAT